MGFPPVFFLPPGFLLDILCIVTWSRKSYTENSSPVMGKEVISNVFFFFYVCTVICPPLSIDLHFLNCYIHHRLRILFFDICLLFLFGEVWISFNWFFLGYVGLYLTFLGVILSIDETCLYTFGSLLRCLFLHSSEVSPVQEYVSSGKSAYLTSLPLFKFL